MNRIVSALFRTFLGICGASSIIAFNFAFAQSNNSSGTFFPPNYAKDPLRGGSGKQQEQPLDASNSDDLFAPRAPSAVPTDNHQAGFTLMGEPTPTPTPAPDEDLAALTEPVAVKSIGAIINCDDQNHFAAQLTTLRDFVVQHDTSVGDVYAVCRTPKWDTEFLLPLSVRGMVFRVVEEPPSQYPVNTSPTWIVTTEKGEHLLEGQPELARAFNSQGELLTKK